MKRSPALINASELEAPKQAMKYVQFFRRSRKLFDIQETQLHFKQNDIPAVYKCDGRYCMFRNFLWYFTYPYQSFANTSIQVDVFPKPKNVQSEIDEYMLHVMHQYPCPKDSPQLVVDVIKDLLPKLPCGTQSSRHNKSIKYSRRSLSRICNISEGVFRRHMN